MGKLIPRFRVVIDRRSPLGFRVARADVERARIYANSFKDGKILGMTLKGFRKPCSYLQHRYYRGIVIPMISEYHGHDDHEYFHVMMKMIFLRDHDLEYLYKKKHGHEPPYPIPRSTADLSTLEFVEYIEKVRRWAAEECGIDIPDPRRIEEE